MMKSLRLALVLALAMVCGNMFAQTTVWEEDWSEYTDPNANPANVNSNYTFEGSVLNDDGTVKSGTKIYNANLAGGTAPELLIAKNGGSFTAKINMNGVSGNLTLQFKCNKSNLTVTAEGATLGDVTALGNDYSYPVTVASGTSSISITFKMSANANARFDNAKLFSGTAKKPAGLSWGTASRTVTIGEDNTFPTLTNGNNLSVIYSSSDESVATINSNGDITLKAAGKTTITAKFDGNSEYEAGEVSYELTVKEGTGDPNPQGGSELSVATALEKINALGTEKTAYVDNKAVFEVKGYIVDISDMSPKPDGYGNATFTIADSKGGSPVLTVFRCKDIENKDFTDANRIKVGDLVVVKGCLQIYVKGTDATPEVSTCQLVSINGSTEAGSDNPGDNPSTTTEISVSTALEKINALGTEKTAYVDNKAVFEVKGYIVEISEMSPKPDGYGNATFTIADTKGGSPVLTVFRCKDIENQDFTDADKIKVGDLVVVKGALQIYVKGTDATPEVSTCQLVSINGSTTGINKATVEGAEDAPAYNIAGQKVNASYKGIVIKNGKKVIKK
ncbi:MAG: Ig-like domain-containing protein [Prevotella sp.]|nr:Ig-like domain-containing protein [Prevotella sp.]